MSKINLKGAKMKAIVQILVTESIRHTAYSRILARTGEIRLALLKLVAEVCRIEFQEIEFILSVGPPESIGLKDVIIPNVGIIIFVDQDFNLANLHPNTVEEVYKTIFPDEKILVIIKNF